MEIVGRSEIDEVTEADARLYRDHWLDRVAGSTTKTRIRYMKALFSVAKQEDWIKTNPFDCINLRYIKSEAKPKEAKGLGEVDQLVRAGRIPEWQAQLYWLMRYTGTHVGEASGIRYEDIDLERRVIRIRRNDLRPLKNEYRQRDLPMVDALFEVMAQVKTQETGHVFPGLYDDKRKRWGNGMSWHRRIGVSPKACRDAVATRLRDAEVNERVLGSILGHTPKTSTGVYGGVSLEAKRKALECLTS